MPLELSGSLVISGSMTVSGSIGYTGSLQSTGDSTTDVTGSLFGTSSWARNAVSASWAPCTCDTGSFAITGSNTFIGNQTISGSLNVTGNSNFQSDLIVTGTLAAPFSMVVPTAINIAPSPDTGSFYFDIYNDRLSFYNGTTWTTSSLIVNGLETINGSLNVTGDSNFQSDLAVTGTLAVEFNIVVPTTINIDPAPPTGSMYLKPGANELWIYTGNSATGWVTASLGI